MTENIRKHHQLIASCKQKRTESQFFQYHSISLLSVFSWISWIGSYDVTKIRPHIMSFFYPFRLWKYVIVLNIGKNAKPENRFLHGPNTGFLVWEMAGLPRFRETRVYNLIMSNHLHHDSYESWLQVSWVKSQKSHETKMQLKSSLRVSSVTSHEYIQITTLYCIITRHY